MDDNLDLMGLYNSSWSAPQEHTDLDFWMSASFPLNAEEEEFKEEVVLKEEKKLPLDNEEKRRRNTVASAKFRAKRKKRDVAKESETTELRETVKRLERLLAEKEVEMKLLRILLLERKSQ